jgi:predicted RNA binding protein YcfA (HicA-like mRNA interferase family)
MAKKERTPLERNSRRILQRLKADGWVVVSIEGSHHKLKHKSFSYPIILVHPRKDLPIGTARKIHKAAGWLQGDHHGHETLRKVRGGHSQG